ncbi:25869_t:CDS:1, partial [Gigaspora margarita]
QDQTIPIMRLYLSKFVFAYGQLYVTLLEVQSKDKIKVLVVDGHIEGKEGIYTRNVVYKEIFV